MRIALDARPLTTSRAGIATYLRGLLYGFGEIEHDAEVVLYAKEAAPPGLMLGPRMRWRALPARLWLPLAVPRAARAGRIDLFHGTNHMAPPHMSVPTVITVHDLSLLSLPAYHTWRNRLLTVPQMLLSLRRAARVIAVSRYTAADLERHAGVDAARIRVVHEAPAPGLAPSSAPAIAALRQRLELPECFFLFLGALEPRKNVGALVRALGRLYADGDTRAALVIAGAEGWRNDDVYREVRRLGLERAVRFVGYVAVEDLPALYGAAVAFVYPSHFEGFGLPPLEAMACGAPVICSNASSLPEVVGDAALLVDPRSDDELAAALRRMLDEDTLRRQLIAAGRERAALYSWARAARETLEVYREAAADRPVEPRKS